MSDNHPIIFLDVLKGRSYLLVQSALASVQQRHLNIGPYTIQVVDEEAYPAVVFTDGNAPSGSPKRFGVRPDSGFDLNQREMVALTSGLDRKVQDTVQGSSLPYIQAALAVFPFAQDLVHYQIKVVGEGASVVVIFTDKDRRAGAFGSGGGRPGYEVAMQAGDRHVLRAHFIR